MKKFLSLILALTILVTSLSFATSAFAASNNIRNIVCSTKCWEEIERDEAGSIVEFVFSKYNKVKIIYEAGSKVVKYKIVNNQIIFCQNQGSLKVHYIVSRISGSRLLKLRIKTKYSDYTTFLDAAGNDYSLKSMYNSLKGAWDSKALRKIYSTFQGVRINYYYSKQRKIEGFIPMNGGGEYIYAYSSSKNTATFITEGYCSPNLVIVVERYGKKVNAFIFKNGSNNYIQETWTRVE